MVYQKGNKENCSTDLGKFVPLVNFNDCGGKTICEAICPYDVFEMRPITQEDKKQLNLKGKIKTFFNKQKAYLLHPDQCAACGYCVKQCPEKAIKLKLVNQ